MLTTETENDDLSDRNREQPQQGSFEMSSKRSRRPCPYQRRYLSSVVVSMCTPRPGGVPVLRFVVLCFFLLCGVTGKMGVATTDSKTQRWLQRQLQPQPRSLDSTGTNGNGNPDVGEVANQCERVRRLLIQRYGMILEGKRERILNRGMSRRDGSNRASSGGIFPDDVTSLDWGDNGDDDVGVEGNDSSRIMASTSTGPSWFALCQRAVVLAWNFGPCAATMGLAWLVPFYRRRFWYPLLTRSLAASGPAFIKWGQWSSTRPDMFPEALCASLTVLTARAPAHSWSFTERVVEESLLRLKERTGTRARRGNDHGHGHLHRVFSSISREPLASGSIAQVHQATLATSSRYYARGYDDEEGGVGVDEKDPVVILKVRHPRVAELLEMDFRLMDGLAAIVDSIPTLSWLGVRSSVQQFSHTMAAQAKLAVEAHHLELLNRNFRHWPAVGFPQPIYADDAIIIETFEKGVLVTDVFSTYSKPEYGPPEDVPIEVSKFIVTIGCSLYLKMMMEDGLMHADLHPGNILLRFHVKDDDTIDNDNDTIDKPTGHPRSHFFDLDDASLVTLFNGAAAVAARRGGSLLQPHVTLVDAGMVARLTPDESLHFVGFLVACGEGDGHAAAHAVLRFGDDNDNGTGTDGDQKTPEEVQAFVADMKELFARICRGYGTNTDLGDVLRGVLGLVRVHRIRIGANYATLVINALCVQSMAAGLVPNYNVLDASKPLFDSFRHLCNFQSGCQGGLAVDSVGSFFRKKVLIPFLFWKKRTKDEAFFRNEQKMRRRREQQFKGALVVPAVGTITGEPTVEQWKQGLLGN